MTKRTHSLRHAGSAIAAALAIASTPSLAQDAAAPLSTAPEPVPQPVIVVPDIPVPVVPEPTVVLPTDLPETAPPPPEASIETPVPAPFPSASASRTPVAAPAARSAAEPAPRADASPAAPVDAPAIAQPLDTAPPVALQPATPVVAPQQAPTAANDAGFLALILGGLVFLALAIWGFIAIGRRKPVRRYAAERPAAKPAPVEQAPGVAERPLVAPFAPRPAPVSGLLPHAGASVALPARVPESYAERDALMKRMIAARPDRANPFTDRGARTKRARLILQSLGRDFGQAEPWIDLSQYPNNWPELARQRSAAA